jgi:hypothetical protein
VPPDAGDPLVKPKSTRVAHPGRICPRNIFGFLGFFGFSGFSGLFGFF